MSVYNSILTGNSGGDCAGSLNNNYGNIIRDNSCSHDGLNTDPMLLLLAGSPAYYAPEAGSPAIDAGDTAYCLANDQRGLLRPTDACDMNLFAYEPVCYCALLAALPAESGARICSKRPADRRRNDVGRRRARY